MRHLLYIEASPRKERSASIEVAQAFLRSLMREEAVTVDTLNLWSTKLPEFNGSVLAAKYAGLSGEALTPEQADAWAAITALVKRFRRPFSPNTSSCKVPWYRGTLVPQWKSNVSKPASASRSACSRC